MSKFILVNTSSSDINMEVYINIDNINYIEDYLKNDKGDSCRIYFKDNNYIIAKSTAKELIDKIQAE